MKKTFAAFVAVATDCRFAGRDARKRSAALPAGVAAGLIGGAIVGGAIASSRPAYGGPVYGGRRALPGLPPGSRALLGWHYGRAYRRVEVCH
jgi:hypothetical protein